MLFPLLALVVGSVSTPFQGAPSSEAAIPASPAVRALTGRDSTRVLRLAHQAQANFESARRRLLPYESLNGGRGCDDAVGNYCLRQQFTSPPNESPQIIAARTRLLVILDSLGTLLPGDRWIIGQRLRYLMEAGQPNTADSMAVTCAARSLVAATSSWCLALVGYTAQQLGNYSRADAAFTSALERMPAQERCRWEDIGQLLGRSAAGPYRRVDCQARDTVTAGFWRLVQPLYLNSVNDLRTEILARITRLYIEQDTGTPMSDWWGSDDRTALLRYGIPLWYTRGEIPRGEMRPQIAGFRREPAFNFFPDAHAFSSPGDLSVTDWDFASLLNTPTYAPLWAISFRRLADYQVALFRRADSALVVAAYDIDDGSVSTATRRAGTFVAVVDRGGVLTPFGNTISQAGKSVVATLMAPWRPMVVSLEVLNPSSGSAGRARFAPKLPSIESRLSLSDLLLYTPWASAPKTLAEAVPRSLLALRAPMDRQIGVFWEAYGMRPQGEPVDYAVLVAPADESIFHRALVKLHVTDPERTVSVQWREVSSPVNGIASRGLTVDLSHLRPGRYFVRVSMTSGIDKPIIAEREFEIL